MHTIVTDNQITRNRRVHHVVSPDDLVVFTSPKLAECVEWLRENNVRHFYIDFGEYRAMLYLTDERREHHGPITGWLHRTPEWEAAHGASPQAASHIATL